MYINHVSTASQCIHNQSIHPQSANASTASQSMHPQPIHPQPVNASTASQPVYTHLKLNVVCLCMPFLLSMPQKSAICSVFIHHCDLGCVDSSFFYCGCLLCAVVVHVTLKIVIKYLTCFQRKYKKNCGRLTGHFDVDRKQMLCTFYLDQNAQLISHALLPSCRFGVQVTAGHLRCRFFTICHKLCQSLPSVFPCNQKQISNWLTSLKQVSVWHFAIHISTQACPQVSYRACTRRSGQMSNTFNFCF